MSSKDIWERIDHLQSKLENAKRRRAGVHCHAGVIEEAKKYFETVSDRGPKQRCPVCGEEDRDVGSLLAKLRDEHDRLNADLAPIQQEIQSFEIQIRNLTDQLQRLKDLAEDIESQQKALLTARQLVESGIGFSIPNDDDVKVIVDRLLKQIHGELDRINKIVRGSSKRLDAVDDEIAKLLEIIRVLDLTEDIVAKEKVKEAPEYQAMEQARMHLEQMAADADSIREAMESVLQSSAKERLQTARGAIADFFGRLTNRPDYREIEIDPDTYEIQGIGLIGKDRMPVLSFFNQGDMNCAAISIFLGLGATRKLSHKLGFIILDDPSQSLDEAHKSNLVELIDSLPREKQIVISTSEKGLGDDFAGNIVRAKKRYVFERRSVGDGANPKEI